MSCTGIAPVYDSTPAAGEVISFVDTPVGLSSPKTLLVSNTGTATLNVTSLILRGSHASEFKVSTTSFSVDGGNSQSIVNTCEPAATGLRNALLTVKHDASGCPALHGLSCKGIAPAYDSDPSTGGLIAFGNTVIGTNSTETLTIKNTGNAPLIVSNIEVSSEDNIDFTLSSTSLTLAGGSQSAVIITCAPTARGTSTAVLIVTHNASNSPARYPLVCTSVAPVYESTPPAGDTIEFGSIIVGDATLSTLAIRNTGTSTLNITSVSIIGDAANYFSINLILRRKIGAFVVTGSTFSIPAGGDPRTLTITCKPSVAGDRKARVILTHNASGSPAEYPLTCKGIAPVYRSDPSQGSYIYFPDIPVGSSTTTDLIIYQI